jgi:hypothetical protein
MMSSMSRIAETMILDDHRMGIQLERHAQIRESKSFGQVVVPLLLDWAIGRNRIY